MLSWGIRWYYDLLRVSVYFFKFYMSNLTLSIYGMICIILILFKIFSWLCPSFSNCYCNPNSILLYFLFSDSLLFFAILFCSFVFLVDLSFFLQLLFFFVLVSIFLMFLLWFVVFEVSLSVVLVVFSLLVVSIILSFLSIWE